MAVQLPRLPRQKTRWLLALGVIALWCGSFYAGFHASKEQTAGDAVIREDGVRLKQVADHTTQGGTRCEGFAPVGHEDFVVEWKCYRRVGDGWILTEHYRR